MGLARYCTKRARFDPDRANAGVSPSQRPLNWLSIAPPKIQDCIVGCSSTAPPLLLLLLCSSISTILESLFRLSKSSQSSRVPSPSPLFIVDMFEVRYGDGLFWYCLLWTDPALLLCTTNEYSAMALTELLKSQVGPSRDVASLVRPDLQGCRARKMQGQTIQTHHPDRSYSSKLWRSFPSPAISTALPPKLKLNCSSSAHQQWWAYHDAVMVGHHYCLVVVCRIKYKFETTCLVAQEPWHPQANS